MIRVENVNVKWLTLAHVANFSARDSASASCSGCSWRLLQVSRFHVGLARAGFLVPRESDTHGAVLGTAPLDVLLCGHSLVYVTSLVNLLLLTGRHIYSRKTQDTDYNSGAGGVISYTTVCVMSRVLFVSGVNTETDYQKYQKLHCIVYFLRATSLWV
jgi:hypothetical protein